MKRISLPLALGIMLSAAACTAAEGLTAPDGARRPGEASSDTTAVDGNPITIGSNALPRDTTSHGGIIGSGT